jgi:hypothetical protein
VEQFAPYLPATWQEDGMTTYSPLKATRRGARKVRGAAWVQVIASSAMGFAVALTSLPVHAGLSGASLSFPISKENWAPQQGRLPTLLAAIERRDVSQFSPELLQIAARVAHPKKVGADDIDAWATGVAKDIIDARD